MNASIRHDVTRFRTSDGDSMRSQRDALTTRVLVLEAALACISRETELPVMRPETSFIAVNRIASVARQALNVERHVPPPASTRRVVGRARSVTE